MRNRWYKMILPWHISHVSVACGLGTSSGRAGTQTSGTRMLSVKPDNNNMMRVMRMPLSTYHSYIFSINLVNQLSNPSMFWHPECLAVISSTMSLDDLILHASTLLHSLTSSDVCFLREQILTYFAWLWKNLHCSESSLWLWPSLALLGAFWG